MIAEIDVPTGSQGIDARGFGVYSPSGNALNGTIVAMTNQEGGTQECEVGGFAVVN